MTCCVGRTSSRFEINVVAFLQSHSADCKAFWNLCNIYKFLGLEACAYACRWVSRSYGRSVAALSAMLGFEMGLAIFSNNGGGGEVGKQDNLLSEDRRCLSFAGAGSLALLASPTRWRGLVAQKGGLQGFASRAEAQHMLSSLANLALAAPVGDDFIIPFVVGRIARSGHVLGRAKSPCNAKSSWNHEWSMASWTSASCARQPRLGAQSLRGRRRCSASPGPVSTGSTWFGEAWNDFGAVKPFRTTRALDLKARLGRLHANILPVLRWGGVIRMARITMHAFRQATEGWLEWYFRTWSNAWEHLMAEWGCRPVVICPGVCGVCHPPLADRPACSVVGRILS